MSSSPTEKSYAEVAAEGEAQTPAEAIPPPPTTIENTTPTYFSTDYFLSPVLAPEHLLARFPKTYFLTGERDPLVDSTVIFAGRIRQAKKRAFRQRQETGAEWDNIEFEDVATNYVVTTLLPGVSHGFMQMVALYPPAWELVERCAGWIRNLYEEQHHETADDARVRVGGLRSARNNRSGGSEGENPLEMASIPRSLRMTSLRTSNAKKKRNPEPKKDDLEQLKIQTQRTENESRHEFSKSPEEGDHTPVEKGGAAPAVKLTNEQIKAGLPELPMQRPSKAQMIRLPSEADLMARRMGGLTGGLMGIGEGARTP
ncbi:Elongation factor 2 [Ascosphaera pollenicola]|nr:Elongation factor 2 [Ascosphaera pollenicola]